MSFDAATKASVLANLAALTTQVEAVQPTDELQQQLEQAQEENIGLLSRIDGARSAVGEAQQALTTAALALNLPS